MSPAPTIPSGEETDEKKHHYNPRQQRRLYRRLLQDIPLLSPLPLATSLYDPCINYDVSESQWVTNTVTNVLDPSSLPPS
jgi:hypothetical protein